VHQGEYYALFLLAMVGMLLMAGATSFLIIFVGLEMFSLALYILCGFIAQRKTSQEAGMKYFLLSSFASAFLLYGIALIYAATGSTFFVTIKSFIGQQHHAPLLLLVGMGLLTVGFAFKVSAVPFQSWTPDVYQGAPAPVTAFMSVGTKVAALLAFVRVFGFMLLPVQGDWMPVIWAIAVLTIIGGNIMALGQTNIKRMLAYSSVAHGGYLLIGVVVGGSLGAAAILFYLSCYLFMNLGAFGLISMLERLDNSGYGIEDLRGLWGRRPVVAGLLAFFLLSLAGFPPMAGFAGKYYIFYAALQGGHPELLIIGILASLLGIYYYLRFIATMFMERSEPVHVAHATMPVAPKTSARVIPATPRSRSGPTRAATGGLSTSGGVATAVAVRTGSVNTTVTKPPMAVEVVAEQEVGRGLLSMTWLALGIAALGTLVVGVLLPIWLPNLQQAAGMLLR
jgi:NADH-quinone oxidoreductase subunit N